MTNKWRVSVLNNFCKVFESIIDGQIVFHFKFKLNPKQHNFITQKLSVTST
jgi:hypothetical protein